MLNTLKETIYNLWDNKNNGANIIVNNYNLSSKYDQKIPQSHIPMANVLRGRRAYNIHPHNSIYINTN